MGVNNSIITIVDLFRDIAERHYMIQEFGYGPNWEISRDINYPYLWVGSDETTIIKTDNGYKVVDFEITLRLADKINNMEVGATSNNYGELQDNGLNITSDTQRVLLDIVNEMDQHPYYKELNLHLVDDIVLTPFFDSELGKEWGWETTFSVRTPNFDTYCIAPMQLLSGSVSTGGLPVDNTQSFCEAVSECPVIIGLSQSIDSITFSNIYTNDGTITANRTITADDNTIIFSNPSAFEVKSAKNIIFECGKIFQVTSPTTTEFDGGSFKINSDNLTINSETYFTFNRAVMWRHDMTTTNLDWYQGNIFTLTLTQSSTINFSNEEVGQTITVAISQDSVGGWTASFTPSTGSIKWKDGTQPTITSASASTDVFTFIKADPSNIYGAVIQNFS